MAATLTAVAAMDKRIMNLEKDFCLLKAIRFPMNNARFNGMVLVSFKTTGNRMKKWKKFKGSKYKTVHR